jgi:hypothetical protein
MHGIYQEPESGRHRPPGPGGLKADQDMQPDPPPSPPEQYQNAYAHGSPPMTD